jgi:hypothetical protein
MRGALLIFALALPPAAAAQDYYGAIAYSSSRKAHGWSSNHPSRVAAQKAALSFCGEHAPDCRIQVWFKNACATLATGPGGYGTAWGSTQAAADSEALKLCGQHSKGCTVARRVCTEGKK